MDPRYSHLQPPTAGSNFVLKLTQTVSTWTRTRPTAFSGFPCERKLVKDVSGKGIRPGVYIVKHSPFRILLVVPTLLVALAACQSMPGSSAKKAPAYVERPVDLLYNNARDELSKKNYLAPFLPIPASPAFWSPAALMPRIERG